MRKLFEEQINKLHEEMHLELSIIDLKSEINDYLREKDEGLKKAPALTYIWAANIFESWMQNTNIDEVMEDITEYIKSTIIILRLPKKEHKALLKANIKYLDDLKDIIKHPQQLVTVTGLSIDLVENIITNYTLYVTKA